jgi:hypothetical protein
LLKRFANLSQRKQVLIIAAAVLFAIVGISGGCDAHRRPPALSAEERALLQGAPLPYSVTVALWDLETDTGQNPEGYAGRLAKLVAASGAFKANRYERSPNPVGQDLVATSTGLYCNSAVIPVFTLISLGIIPTVFQEEQCEGMLLRAAANQPKRNGVEVTARFKGTFVMGWAAVVCGAMPGWSYGPVATDSRFVQRFRLAVIRRREELARILGR